MSLTWQHLNQLIETLPKPKPIFDKDGNQITETSFRLPMSKEAARLALRNGWKHRVIYRKDSNSKLVPELTFDIPEAKKTKE